MKPSFSLLNLVITIALVVGGGSLFADPPAERAPSTPSAEQESSKEDNRDQVADELADLRSRLLAAEERIEQLETDPSVAPEGRVAMSSARDESPAALLTFSRGGVSATIGGYLDLEYRDEHGSSPTFRQHRFVPLIDAKFGERFHFAAEIEFEDGGSDAPAGDGSTKVEFAALDWRVGEEFTFRAGAILVPLGRFNLYHDSPLNDFTDRPLVTRSVIPTTLTDAGVGVLGSYETSESGVLDYQFYAVNGFEGLEPDSTSPTGFSSNFNTSSGLRGGRPSLKSDGSKGISGTGRVGYSPILGVDLGVSGFHGAYDSEGDRDLFVSAFDWKIEGGALTSSLAGWGFGGEVARADIERDSVARDSGVPDDLWGFVAETQYHFMPESFLKAAPSLLSDESTFTAAVRFDHVELGSERTQRWTFGLNFRPIEETVFKFDYQVNLEDGSHTREDNDAILFSVATYF